MTASNPYTSVSIAGYNAAPVPSDDGARVGSNQLEWGKHKTKIGDPIKTLAEGVNTAVLAAFDALIMTDDPAQETVIGAMTEFIDPPSPARRSSIAATLDPNENALIMISEFT